MNRFGIIAHTKKPAAERVARQIIEWLKRKGLHYCVSGNLANLITDAECRVPPEKLPEQVDCLLSLGGDGTMLSSARVVGYLGLPIFGINVGSLGFLTEIVPQEVSAALEKLTNDDFHIEERMILETTISGTENATYSAMNDVVLDHGDSIRLINMDLYSNREFVCSYNADGLIISTPTGSTAYNLAAGGPVIHPKLGALIATPICPHSLTLRPIIFDDRSELAIKVADGDIDVRLTVDGQVSCILGSESEIFVKKAPYNIKLIRIKDYRFFEILRTKLHWGAKPPHMGPYGLTLEHD